MTDITQGLTAEPAIVPDATVHNLKTFTDHFNSANLATLFLDSDRYWIAHSYSDADAFFVAQYEIGLRQDQLVNSADQLDQLSVEPRSKMFYIFDTHTNRMFLFYEAILRETRTYYGQSARPTEYDVAIKYGALELTFILENEDDVLPTIKIVGDEQAVHDYLSVSNIAWPTPPPTLVFPTLEGAEKYINDCVAVPYAITPVLVGAMLVR